MTNTHKNNSLSIMERILRLRQYMVSMLASHPDEVPNNNSPTIQSTLQIHGDTPPKESPTWADWDDAPSWEKWK